MRWYRKKKVMITGGSSGIGKAAAQLLVQWGADVMIAARGVERLDQALAEIRSAASPDQIVERLVLDVADRPAVQACAESAVGTLGGLDILINNAGIAHPGYIQDIPDEIFEAMMRVNYFGTVNATRAFVPHLVRQRSGHVCNVSSVLGFMGIFGYTAYAASKFAVTGFSECLRQELLPHKVHVSVVFPADTDTPQLHEENKIKPPETKAIAGNVKAMQPDDVARSMLEGIAAQRYQIVPGFGGKFTYFMHRHFPAVVRLFIDTELKKQQRRQTR